MPTFDIQDFKEALLTISVEMIAQKDNLTDIDSKLGDGDMGMSMEKAALAIRKVITEDTSTAAPGPLLVKCASEMNRAASSTLGSLLSFGVMTVGRQLGSTAAVSEEAIVGIPSLLVETIMKFGKAQEGDKTILDALCPYARALRQAWEETNSLKQAAIAAADAANKGAEGTKGRIAKTGRAKWLQERNMEYPDGGAFLAARVAEKLVRR